MRKGTDHAVFLPFAGGAEGRAQPRPLHRLVRLVLPHPRLLGREPDWNRAGRWGEAEWSGDPFFLPPLVRRVRPRVMTGDGDNADKVKEKMGNGKGEGPAGAGRNSPPTGCCSGRVSTV